MSKKPPVDARLAVVPPVKLKRIKAPKRELSRVEQAVDDTMDAAGKVAAAVKAIGRVWNEHVVPVAKRMRRK